MSDQNSGFAPGWPSNTGEAVEVAPSAELQLTEEQKDERIQRWLTAKDDLERVKSIELEYRSDVTSALFPTPKKGTQRYISPKGYGAIKLVFGWNYSLGDKEKVDGSTGLKVPIADQVEAVLDQIEALGERGALIAGRLVRWKPELVPTEYEALAASQDGTDIEAKTLIDAILTVSPSTPQLSFEPPKAKK